ncbi:MAG: hypothetical protein JNK02_02140 [Planctomycetes bacterium]|nr:hypothetical protein [Planctomycetota bacterium]
MMLTRRASRVHGRRGSAMLAALLVVFAVSTLTMIHIQLDLSKAHEQRGAVDTKRAFYVAEAGLAEAYYGVVTGRSGNVGTEDEPARFANGIFWTTAKEEGLGRVTLTSTGMCGAGRATLALVIERTSRSVASLGFFGDHWLVMEADATVDSYDSSEGRYALPILPVGGPLPDGARVGSNQDLTIGQGCKVLGDARPGPAGILVRDGSAVVAGSTSPYELSNEMPPIEVPTFENLGAIATTLLRPIGTIAAGEKAYDTIRVTTGTTLTIKGPARVVVSDLVVDALGQLVFDTTNGPIELYVTDWLAWLPGSLVSTSSQDPRSVSILVTASVVKDQDRNGTPDLPVILGASGSLHGTLYAPQAGVSLPSTLQVFGAVGAKYLLVKAGAKLHFDTSLLEASEEEGALPRLVGWRLVELPNVPVVKLRYDALRSLLQQGVDVKLGSTAHFDIGVLDTP